MPADLSPTLDATGISDRPERSRNAQAQARHRAKRKAYIEQLELSVQKLQMQLGLSSSEVADLPSPMVRIRELEEENQRLRWEIQRMRQSGSQSVNFPSYHDNSLADPPVVYSDLDRRREHHTSTYSDDSEVLAGDQPSSSYTAGPRSMVISAPIAPTSVDTYSDYSSPSTSSTSIVSGSRTNLVSYPQRHDPRSFRFDEHTASSQVHSTESSTNVTFMQTASSAESYASTLERPPMTMDFQSGSSRSRRTSVSMFDRVKTEDPEEWPSGYAQIVNRTRGTTSNSYPSSNDSESIYNNPSFRRSSNPLRGPSEVSWPPRPFSGITSSHVHTGTSGHSERCACPDCSRMNSQSLEQFHTYNSSR